MRERADHPQDGPFVDAIRAHDSSYSAHSFNRL